MKQRAFTMVELMTVVALVSLVFSIAVYTIVQVSRVVKASTIAATRQLELLKASEQIRWQIRCAYATPSAAARPDNDQSISEAKPGHLGLPGSAIYGQTSGKAGQDYILMVTSNPKNTSGVVEVGYRVENGKLLYRQFAARDSAGFHTTSDYQEAAWTVLTPNLKSMKLEYTSDGSSWQTYWDTSPLPQRVRVALDNGLGTSLEFEVSPALGSARW